MVGDDTFVRVRRHAAGDGASLTGYEGMVLDHVAGLAGHTEDGRVPARALTTGPEHSAKRWWRNFRSSVVDEARGRGLSRPRWPAGLKAVMIGAAVPVALTVALAASTARDDPSDPDDNPVEGAFAAGLITLVGAGALVGSRSGERDTPEGRQAAARWLGLREALGEDPLFAEQPPAAVAIWDHLLAHGTALGVAHGVVAALPMGTESDTEAWSPFGGRWRVVRVRYPRRLPPGYGLHPGLAVLYGLLHLLITATMLPLAVGVAGPLVDELRDGGFTSGDVPDEVDLFFEGFAALIGADGRPDPAAGCDHARGRRRRPGAGPADGRGSGAARARPRRAGRGRPRHQHHPSRGRRRRDDGPGEGLALPQRRARRSRSRRAGPGEPLPPSRGRLRGGRPAARRRPGGRARRCGHGRSRRDGRRGRGRAGAGSAPLAGRRRPRVRACAGG